MMRDVRRSTPGGGGNRNARRGAAARLVAALLLPALTACGAEAAARGLRPSRPWSPALTEVFDDGADYVAPLRTILGTPWFDRYGETLERRLSEADVVAVVRLRSIAPPGGAHAYGAVEVDVERSLHGGAAAGDLLRLDVAGGSAAADRLEDERDRLESFDRFVAYVRLYDAGASEIRCHWHLSPYDGDLVATIQRTLSPPP